MSVDRVYICSGIFIAHLKGTEQYSPECLDLLDAGREGAIELHTSYLTMTEVIASQRSVLRRPPDDEKRITQLLDAEYIQFSAVELLIAEMSRAVSWDYQIRAADAVHVATAINRKCQRLYTVDTALVSKSKASFGRVALPDIRLPELTARQPKLPFPNPNGGEPNKGNLVE